MPDRTIDRLAWCLRSYKNAATQGRTVSTDVTATAEQALREYDVGILQDQEDARVVDARIGGTT